MGIILDTETTGLLMPRLAANELQPQIIEIYIGKFDEKTFEVTDEYHSFVKPINALGNQLLLEDPVNNLKHITRITGITDDMLVDAPTFDEIAEDIFEFWEEEDLVVAHNLMFDLEIVHHNYVRVKMQELEHDFRRKVCTVEMSYCLKKKRIRLGELYQMATGRVMENAHRAKDDAMANLETFRWLIQEGL